MILEFAIIHLIYVPRQQRKVVVTRQRNEPSESDETVADWFSETLVKERFSIRYPTKQVYREFKIYTGDESLFTIDGVLYAQVYLFMGLTTYYWIFFSERIRREGSAPLTWQFCSKCLYNIVPSIIQAVKKWINVENTTHKDNKDFIDK